MKSAFLGFTVVSFALNAFVYNMLSIGFHKCAV